MGPKASVFGIYLRRIFIHGNHVSPHRPVFHGAVNLSLTQCIRIVKLLIGDNLNVSNRLKFAGHFTQVVWKASIILGVGKATSASGRRYVVARYKPRGNMWRGYKTNVPPPVTGK